MTTAYLTTSQSLYGTYTTQNVDVAQGVTIDDFRVLFYLADGDPGPIVSPLITIHGTIGSFREFTDSTTYFFDYQMDTSGGTGLNIVLDATGSVTNSMYLRGARQVVSNAGLMTASTNGSGSALIFGSVYGQTVNEANSLTNSGTITSAFPLSLSYEFNATIVSHAVQGLSLVNSGTISSTNGYALYIVGGALDLVNTGTIQGAILASELADHLDLRGGTLQGAVEGRLGNDTILGSALADQLYGGGGGDFLQGNGGADSLFGGDGGDTLSGGGGIDTLDGGAGNDTYLLTDSQDILQDSGGFDTVKVSFALNLGTAGWAAGFEAYGLTGTADLALTGAGLNDNLTGNAGRNVVTGADGNDMLAGLSGNDVLYGGQGIDTLHGGTGDDLLVGGSLRDYLYGDAGVDTMRGGAGGDVYYVDNPGDVVDESVAGAGGVDVVRSSLNIDLTDTLHFKGDIEKAVLTGVTPLSARGNALANTLTANMAQCTLDGGLGNDTLTGLLDGVAVTTFVFSTALGPDNIDLITGFTPPDRIALDDAIFAGLSPGPLSPAQFGAFATGPAILENPVTGALSYDPDGTGPQAAVQFAVVQGAFPGIIPVLGAGSFLIY